ncbi:MAG: YihA family ribosome biogenesis GTP-binding protein [Bacteroidetes bacterium]|nr:YihA family ribosome biogenesis GTP-binding protein [Bacteroidota bacterium]
MKSAPPPFVYVSSQLDVQKMPTADRAEFAVAGRSNVGKSSLINMLAGQKGLARTSGQPGKTQTINHYKVGNQAYLADLPGYGYAKVSQNMRSEWSKHLKAYLAKRSNLSFVLLLIDCRVEPRPNDLEFARLLTQNQRSFVIIFTKTDKLKSTALKKQTEAFLSALPNPPHCHFLSSSQTGRGREEILKFVADHAHSFHPTEWSAD